MKKKFIEKQLSKLEEIVSKTPWFYRFLKKIKVMYQKAKFQIFKLFGRQTELAYDKTFFDRNLEWNLPIAKDMVNVLIDFFNPQSVVDVGCGNAEFLMHFEKKGIKVRGYEGSSNAIANAQIDKSLIVQHDLTQQIVSPEEFDLALCLEVAEHIENKYSEMLVRNLSQLSDVVIFTAAPPGQGGHFHINEQPKMFWKDLWETKGYGLDEELTENIKKNLRQKEVIWWYCDNLMIFKKRKR